MKQYLVLGLPAALGFPDSSPERVEAPLAGRRTLVRVVLFRGQKLLVRAYPAGFHHDADVHYHAAALLSENHVRVPHVLHFTETPFRNGMVFLIEEYVEGEHRWGGDLGENDISLLAKEVARLHSITSKNWGPLLSPRTEDYSDVLIRRVYKRLDRLVQREVITDPAEVQIMREWFTERFAGMGDLPHYVLTHGQLHRENVLFTAAGEVVLLDYGTLQFAAPHTDLVYISHHILADAEELIRSFLRRYLDELPAENTKSFNENLELFTALFYLSRVNSRWKRHRRRGAQQHERVETLRQSQYLQKLRALIRGEDSSAN